MFHRLTTLLPISLMVASAGSAPRAPLTVYAAASLTNAFNEIADSLKARQPGLRVDFNFAGSQALALQIEQGARADVFASADDHWMAVVRDSGLIDGAPRVFAHNHLVVIVPRANPGHITTVQDLAKSGVKLVLAGEAVPVGHYARAAMTAIGNMPGYPAGFAARALANVVSNEDNVKGVVAKVQLGEADAGIVYVSDVTPSVARATSRIELPAAANALADYPIAVLRKSANTAAARALIELVMSPVGQDVLARNGFVAVGATH